MAENSGPLHAALATVRQTNAAHVSALDALERASVAETALFLLRLSIPNDQKGSIEDHKSWSSRDSPCPIETRYNGTLYN